MVGDKSRNRHEEYKTVGVVGLRTKKIDIDTFGAWPRLSEDKTRAHLSGANVSRHGVTVEIFLHFFVSGTGEPGLVGIGHLEGRDIIRVSTDRRVAKIGGTVILYLEPHRLDTSIVEREIEDCRRFLGAGHGNTDLDIAGRLGFRP